MRGLLRLASLHRYRWVAHIEKGEGCRRLDLRLAKECQGARPNRC